MLAAMIWSTFLWRLYTWFKSTWESHEHLCLQVAQLDTYAGEIRVDCDKLQVDTNNMRQTMTELEEAQGMVSDGTDAIHYAVVEMGGYVRMTELSLEQRHYMYTMYTQERRNLVAANVMGQQRFLQTRQQDRGYAAGQDANVRLEKEGE